MVLGVSIRIFAMLGVKAEVEEKWWLLEEASVHGSRHKAAVSDKPQRRLRALLLHMTHPAILCHPSTPPGLHDARWQIPSSTSCGWSKALENTLAVSEKVACAAQCRVITTSTQSIKNMQFVFNSLPLDPKYFSIQEKTFQRHFSRVNANIVTTLAWIPSGRCMDLYLCKGRVGELATHKRYWFRNCLP